MAQVKFTYDLSAPVIELVQYVLRLYFFLANLFSFDAVLKVESAKACYSNFLVRKLPVKQLTAVLEYKTSPESEGFLTEQKVKLLLL